MPDPADVDRLRAEIEGAICQHLYADLPCKIIDDGPCGRCRPAAIAAMAAILLGREAAVG